MTPSFENFIENCMNEKLQRKRLKVMLARQQEDSNKSLRSGGLPSSYSMCKNEKIRALNNILNQIRSE
jgi:predicted AAA+ superfamily ATPase